jgi:hypothetical protein
MARLLILGTLGLAFVAAQAADLLTYAAWHEVNPLVVHLGAIAPLAKVGMVVVVLALVAAMRPDARADRQPHACAVLVTGIAAGCYGCLTNVAAA